MGRMACFFFLQHLRRGAVNTEQLKMLRSLIIIISKDEAHTIDFSSPFWSDAALQHL